MTKSSLNLVIAIAIAATIALSVVIVLVLFSATGSQSDGISAYAGGVSEIFLVLLAVGFVVSILTLTLWVLGRKRS